MSTELQEDSISNTNNNEVLDVLLNESSADNNTNNNDNEEFKHGIGNILNLLLQFYANKLKSEVKDDKIKEKIDNELLLNDFEVEVINDVTNPFLQSLLSRLGIENKGFYAIISLITIILPRISLVIEVRKKINEEKKQNTNNQGVQNE